MQSCSRSPVASCSAANSKSSSGLSKAVSTGPRVRASWPKTSIVPKSKIGWYAVRLDRRCRISLKASRRRDWRSSSFVVAITMACRSARYTSRSTRICGLDWITVCPTKTPMRLWMARAEALAESPPKGLFARPRLALEPHERVVGRLERREDVEIRPAGPVDCDEILGREDRPEHAAKRLSGLAQQAVEDFPAVGILDVAVLLDVHDEHPEVPAVEQAVAQGVDDDRYRRQFRDRVEKEVAEPDVLVRRLEVGGAGGFAPLIQQLADGREQAAPREGLGDVVVRPDLHSSDEVADLALDRHHRYGDLPRFGSVLQRRADFPSRELRHHHVQQDQIGLDIQRHVDAFPPVARDECHVSRGSENCLDDQQNVVVVVNDQNFFCGHYRAANILLEVCN